MKGESAGNHAQAKRKYQPTGKGQQGKIPETLKGAVSCYWQTYMLTVEKVARLEVMNMFVVLVEESCADCQSHCPIP